MSRVDDALGAFLARLAAAGDMADRIDLIRAAITDNEGSYLVPCAEDSRASHLVEISLFGIHDTGADEQTAHGNWIATATRHQARLVHVARAEHIVTHDLHGLASEALRQAAETVRLYSQDARALDAARRIDLMIATGQVPGTAA